MGHVRQMDKLSNRQIVKLEPESTFVHYCGQRVHAGIFLHKAKMAICGDVTIRLCACGGNSTATSAAMCLPSVDLTRTPKPLADDGGSSSPPSIPAGACGALFVRTRVVASLTARPGCWIDDCRPAASWRWSSDDNSGSPRLMSAWNQRKIKTVHTMTEVLVFLDSNWCLNKRRSLYLLVLTCSTRGYVR